VWTLNSLRPKVLYLQTCKPAKFSERNLTNHVIQTGSSERRWQLFICPCGSVNLQTICSVLAVGLLPLFLTLSEGVHGRMGVKMAQNVLYSVNYTSYRYVRRLPIFITTSVWRSVTSLYLCPFINQEPGQPSRYSDWLRAERLGFRGSIPAELEISLFSTAPKPALESTQPPIQWVPEALSPGVKRPGREADHSLPSNAEVKNAWRYTSTPIRLHSVVLN
jgi:hypothetical protein